MTSWYGTGVSLRPYYRNLPTISPHSILNPPPSFSKQLLCRVAVVMMHEDGNVDDKATY